MALRGQTVTLLILFIAVLLAYYQKNRNGAAVPRTNVTEPHGPQLPVAESPTPSSTLSSIIPEATDTTYRIPPSPHMPHLKPVPLPTIPTMPHTQKPHTPSVPKINIFKYLAYIPSPVSFIRSILIAQARILSLLVSTAFVFLRALFAPILTLLAPVLVLLAAVFNILVLTPYRVIAYLGKLLYPVYVFIGTAMVLGACVGMVGGAFHTNVVMPAVEPEAPKPTTRSLKGKARAQAPENMPPFSFPERERLRDVTRWVEESWCVCSIVHKTYLTCAPLQVISPGSYTSTNGCTTVYNGDWVYSYFLSAIVMKFGLSIAFVPMTKKSRMVRTWVIICIRRLHNYPSESTMLHEHNDSPGNKAYKIWEDFEWLRVRKGLHWLCDTTTSRLSLGSGEVISVWKRN